MTLKSNVAKLIISIGFLILKRRMLNALGTRKTIRKESPKHRILLLQDKPILPPIILHPLPLHLPTSQLSRRKRFQVPRQPQALRLLPLRSLTRVFWAKTVIFSTANGNTEGKLDFVSSAEENTSLRIVISEKRAKRQRRGLRQLPTRNPKHPSRKNSLQLR